QDALEALAAAGVDRQAILCAQNGVENERAALRRFPNVYGLTVMTPAAYTEPGEVMCHAIPKRGLFDIGRYPSGTDDTVRAIAAAFNASEFDTLVYDDIMRSKYRKLIDNQGNIVRATL